MTEDPNAQPKPKRTRRRTADRAAALVPTAGAPAATVATTTDSPEANMAEATADEVRILQGAIGTLHADTVRVSIGAVGAARADRLDVRFGAVGASLTGTLDVRQGGASNVVARHATVDQSLVQTLIAQDVTFGRPSAVLVLLAGRVSGDVRTLVDWRGALAFGAALGVVAGLLGWRRSGS